MVMSWIFTAIIAISLLAALLTGNSAALASAVPQGAKAGIDLTISIAGSFCLWTGVGKLMEHAGFTDYLSQLLRPLLDRLFPSAKKSRSLRSYLSANICANILGLGNAATPMGIQAAKALAVSAKNHVASDELCRLIVLNTASVQLIPATVAAVRASLGCAHPFDILPAVWITSLCSVSCGLLAAWFLGRIWRK